VRQRLNNLNNQKTPLPTVLLANVQSLRSKTDELQAKVNYLHQYNKAGILAFTETWLSPVPNSELSIDGFGLPIRLDRDPHITGKGQGGGLCFYINERWCGDVKIRTMLSVEDIELSICMSINKKC